ncbi:cell wall metabolism sensor histidine kinase WalK [Salinibacterium sp. SWN248]|uniref:sensor histidine kinase n=1 Tax=Salinibacterium sp. SWN248 TaxID=2792056 RepID=UPI0018CEC25D|nr:HAMP domain-containing sensor histidine kinase [Salinibacterium sp. SWN248]MBH0025121.1 HAMP domain-containing histidine kinase [Salinibacterium sp. SWN248]
MFSKLSIRARITLGSVAAATILLLVALVVVRIAVQDILTEADRSLATSDLTPFVADITANPDESVDDPGTGVLVYITDPNADVQVNTLPRGITKEVTRTDPSDTSIVVQDDGSDHADDEGKATDDDDAPSFVVAGRTLTTDAGTWQLWAARSTAASQLALHGLDRILIVAGVVLLLGFGLASWGLASAALRPVNAMRRKAEQLSGDTDTALPVGGADDELAALATTLNAFLARLRASTDREKQMVSDAAHELRTPLAALTTQLELAHADFGNAEALAVQVTAAEASVDRLTSLATNLLELSRIETEASTATASAGQLVDEFTGSIDRARLLGMAKAARVDFTCSAVDEDARFRIGAQSFGRLVDNLLSNAIAAISTGGGILAALSIEVDGLHLEVTDDGPGMPEQFLPIAFDRFSRPDVSRTGATGGSGLGLALVQAIATAAGGSATVDNTGDGLRATVLIPNM